MIGFPEELRSGSRACLAYARTRYSESLRDVASGSLTCLFWGATGLQLGGCLGWYLKFLGLLRLVFGLICPLLFVGLLGFWWKRFAALPSGRILVGKSIARHGVIR